MVNDKYFDPQFRGVNWQAMRTKYRDQAAAATDDTQLYAVLDRLCHELRESHLSPLPPLRTHEIRTDRRMAVGMGWMALEGRQVITEIVPGGPAEEAGVQVGWIVTSCDGQPMPDGPPLAPRLGRPVTYGFLDLKNEPRNITFQPQLLKFDQLVSRELPGGNRYLRFDRFGPDSLHWLSDQLKEHRRAPGVVLDLRENPGGYVVAFQLAVGEFFDRRVGTGRFVRRNGRAKDSRNLSLLPARYPGKVVILTSGATGSAAEIFAHVLQYHGRATVVGRRTAGAVIVSRTWPLPGGGTLQIPVQDYRGLDGRRLEGRGVLPDIGVPQPALADLRNGRDPDLERALGALGQPPQRNHTLTATAGNPDIAARVIGLP
jgi:carboxyl-terminal processing protease